MATRQTIRLAFVVEPAPQPDCETLDQARLAALPLNAVREAHGLPLLTHAVVYLNGERIGIRPLDPSTGA